MSKKKQMKKNSEVERFESFLNNYSFEQVRHTTYFFELLKVNLNLMKHSDRDSKNSFTFYLFVRAKLFLSMSLYNECFISIKLCMEKGGPIEKCIELKKECDGKMKSSAISWVKGSDWNFFKLTYKANEKVPSLTECLELRENEEFGRFVVTNRELKAGDIIGISEGNFKSIHSSAIYHHCSFCIRSNFLSLFPCPGCEKGNHKYQLVNQF